MINFCKVKLSNHFIQTATIKKHLGQTKDEKTQTKVTDENPVTELAKHKNF